MLTLEGASIIGGAGVMAYANFVVLMGMQASQILDDRKVGYGRIGTPKIRMQASWTDPWPL